MIRKLISLARPQLKTAHVMRAFHDAVRKLDKVHKDHLEQAEAHRDAAQQAQAAAALAETEAKMAAGVASKMRDMLGLHA